jgi:hypothetical protein
VDTTPRLSGIPATRPRKGKRCAIAGLKMRVLQAVSAISRDAMRSLEVVAKVQVSHIYCCTRLSMSTKEYADDITDGGFDPDDVDWSQF